MKKIELIDFLKGYSIFTIVAFHYFQILILPEPFNKFICFGGTGVHLFILLSGLGLYLSYLNQPENYTSYLKKRISKVYVPYIIAVLITVAISIVIPIYEISLYSIFGHIFLYKMFDENIIGAYGYPLWFISLIFQFYIVFYIIIYFKKRSTPIFFVLICLCISICWAFLVMLLGKELVRVWNSFFLQYLWEFAIGMVIASLIHESYKIKFKIKSHYILLIAVICSAIYGYLAILPGGIGKLFNDVPALIGYSFLGIWLYLLKINLVNKFFLFTGKISYFLYLVHILVFSIFSVFFNDFPPFIIFIVALAASYFGAIYYQLLLNPVYKLLNSGSIRKGLSHIKTPAFLFSISKSTYHRIIRFEMLRYYPKNKPAS